MKKSRRTIDKIVSWRVSWDSRESVACRLIKFTEPQIPAPGKWWILGPQPACVTPAADSLLSPQ